MPTHCASSRAKPLPPTGIRSTAIRRFLIWSILLAVLPPTFLVSCAGAPPTEPAAVVKAAYESYNKGDLDGYLGYFSDDAVLCAPGGCSHGIQGIREYITLHVPAGTRRYELGDLVVEGNVVTYTANGYEGSQLVETVYDGLDVVMDGRIIFEGTEAFLRYECDREQAQPFCP
jgi:hypothetical protein